MDKTSLRLQTSRNLIQTQKRGEEREREREREKERERELEVICPKAYEALAQSSDASRAFAKINPTSGSTFRISDAFCTTHFPF